MVIFEVLRYKNLLSAGNAWTELFLNRNKNTLIVGENGAGKSSLLDALSFVLYNKPFRNVNKPQLINSINRKGLVVEVEFRIGDNEYWITRGMKPNIFEIRKNGQMITQDAANKDYQETLEKHILKMNWKSFCQIVVLGSASFTPFMQLPAAHRREVIEDLLDLQIFTKMNNLHKDHCLQSVNTMKDVEYEIKVVEEKIKLQQAHIQEMLQDTMSMIAGKAENIKHNETLVAEYMAEIDTLLEQIEELEGSIADRAKIEKKRTQLRTLDAQITGRIREVKKEMDFYDKNDSCPTCKQLIDPGFKDTTIREKTCNHSALIDGYEKLKEQLTGTEKTLAEYQEILNKVSSFNTRITILNTTVSGCNGSIKRLTKEISDLNSKMKATTVDFTVSFEDERKGLIHKRDEIIFLQEILNHATLILKDSGIKSKIIKQYVPLINTLINRHLAAMEFFCQFELDETFSETIKSRYRDDFSYASFSEGEKMRINLAILFTWRAIAKLRNSAATNLLIMDEVFDSSLDTSGTEEFMKILNSLTPDTNTFIISHKGDALLDKFEHVLRFEKHKSFSRIAA